MFLQLDVWEIIYYPIISMNSDTGWSSDTRPRDQSSWSFLVIPVWRYPWQKIDRNRSTNRRLVSQRHCGPPVFKGEGPDWSLEALLIQVSSESDKYQRDWLSQGLQSAAAQQGFAGPISCSNRSPNSLMCHLLQSHAPNWLEFFFPIAEAIWDGLMSSELWGFSFH